MPINKVKTWRQVTGQQHAELTTDYLAQNADGQVHSHHRRRMRPIVRIRPPHPQRDRSADADSRRRASTSRAVGASTGETACGSQTRNERSTTMTTESTAKAPHQS